MRTVTKRRHTQPFDILAPFEPPVREWFSASFHAPTEAQLRGWPSILEGRSTLLLAPTGSGKTLAAFLVAINRLMFSPEPPRKDRCRLLYVSPLRALAVDVERNLRAPLAEIAAVAERRGALFRVPTVAIRSGDTPGAERAKMSRTPPDILITTPESLYLILTSAARENLASVETVIVDEIHSLVATKRGAHLFLSLERLEELRRQRHSQMKPLQRIGLSATQRPLEEVARLLGGGEVGKSEIRNPKSERNPKLETGKQTATVTATLGVSDFGLPSDLGFRTSDFVPRPVTIVDAGRKKFLELTVEVPVEDMVKRGESEDIPPGPAAQGLARKSIWPSIYPRLVEHIRAHRSTMIFVNSRRLAERLASALNEAAGEEIALAHHSSIAREKRLEIEERLKHGCLPAIIATSSLELGIDMGAVDLVVQIEAPPSVASGLQRIGRAGHRVGATSRGIIFPKYRGDLLCCAAATRLMQEGRVEETFYPRNPLDVLAQQIVALTAMETFGVNDLFNLVRRAAPFADLPRSSFEGVLEMLAGRYPSDEFAELRPRIVWDRVGGTVRGRQGAKRLAVVNAGTIPERGLYGVFLAGEDTRHSRRVGELDEEMVFESRLGDVFLLGASSWRIEEITHDRVLVSPAPGQPGKMPFWHGDRPGRQPELGRAIGELARKLVTAPRAEALKLLGDSHGLDDKAAATLLAYLHEQAAVTGEVPSDRTIVLERFRDELGDWRVCLLSPFGARVHAPWATAVIARWKEQSEVQLDTIWSDDGIIFRLPESDEPTDVARFLPAPDEVEDLVVRSLGTTSLFAARFRENAARALLLPRRAPGRRSPLWAQRKRAADLLAVASRYGTFPIMLETYRECLRDVFDLPGLVALLKDIASHRVRVVTVDSRSPSPFASALLFSYVGNFIYDGDAPLAERRAQILSIDHAQLKELLGEAELRELLDAEAIEGLERSLQRLEGAHPIRNADGLHDLLLALGDLTEADIKRRAGGTQPTVHSPTASGNAGESVATVWLGELLHERRVLTVKLAGENRFIAVEDAARYRDALGIVLPPGLPAALLEPVADPLGDLCSRYARTHGPFRLTDVAARFGLGVSPVRAALEGLAAADRVLEGEFLPGGHGREWCDAEVLRALKRRSLAKLRKEIEPVEPAAFARFLVEWQGATRQRLGLDSLLSVLEQLQGAPLPASALEQEILPARIARYSPADLDTLCAAGEVIWRGLEPLGPHDGRIALYLPDQYPLLAPPVTEAAGELVSEVRRRLATRGALFFSDLQAETGAFSEDLLAALWTMVWAGEVTNDTLAPLRALIAEPEARRHRSFRGRQFRSRRAGPPGSEGRWSLLPRLDSATPAIKGEAPSETKRRTALANQLLERYGVLTREAVHAEGIGGGFSAVYEVLKAMEERGRVRRGYFVAGLGATQFALPGTDERLRALRQTPDEVRTLVLAATDPANPYGAALPWPEPPNGKSEVRGPKCGEEAGLQAEGLAAPGTRPQRAAGAQVVLHQGALVAWIPRTRRNLLTFLPDPEPERRHAAEAIARALARLVETEQRRAVLVSLVNGKPVAGSFLSRFLTEAGFTSGSHGYLKRRSTAPGTWLPGA
jgi:ATP-dependent Lhr-like helicase